MAKRLLASTLGVAAALSAAGCGTTAAPRGTVTAVTTAPTAPTVATSATVPTPTTSVSTVTASTTSTFSIPTAPTVSTPTVDTTAQPPPRPAHLRPGVHVVPPATYTRDVLQSLAALRGFSSTLQGIGSRSQFSAALPSLRRELRTFDGIIRRLRAYQLMSPTLDRQRARLAQQGPGLARTMSDFLDAVRDGNASRARSLAAEIQTRLNAFRKAA